MSAERAKLLHFPDHPKISAPLLRFSEPFRLLDFSKAILERQQETQGLQEPIERQIRSQVENLIDLGFHKELGQAEDEYLRTFSNITELPEEYRGRFDTPLVVERRISLKRQHELARITERVDSDKIMDRRHVSEIPIDRPCIIWIPFPRTLMEETLGESLSGLPTGEIDCVQVEVTSFFIQNRDFFETNRVIMTAMRSRFKEARIPFIEFYDGKAHLDALSENRRSQQSIALLRGEKVTFALAA